MNTLMGAFQGVRVIFCQNPFFFGLKISYFGRDFRNIKWWQWNSRWRIDTHNSCDISVWHFLMWKTCTEFWIKTVSKQPKMNFQSDAMSSCSDLLECVQFDLIAYEHSSDRDGIKLKTCLSTRQLTGKWAKSIFSFETIWSQLRDYKTYTA